MCLNALKNKNSVDNIKIAKRLDFYSSKSLSK